MAHTKTSLMSNHTHWFVILAVLIQSWGTVPISGMDNSGDSLDVEFDLPPCADGRFKLKPKFSSTDACRRAAESGDAKAMFEMAWRHELGHDARKDKSEVVRWLRQAANHGIGQAQVALAYRLVLGEGISTDVSEAVKYYQMAAEQGDVEGQYELGRIYLTGYEHELDEKLGYSWMLKAAEQDLVPAQYAVGYLSEFGIGTKRNYSRAVDWYQKAALKKHPTAQWRLGILLREGRGVIRDDKEGLRWILKAATQGSVQAQWDAAQILLNDNKNSRRIPQSIRWLEKLAKNGHRKGQIQLANIAPKNYKRTTRLLSLNRNTASRNQEGSAVRMSGWISSLGGDSWTLQPRPRKSVEVNVSKIPRAPAKYGRYVTVYGILDSGRIEALLYYFPDPEYKYTYKVVIPGGVAGGHEGTYYVDGTIRNTGKQPITSITLRVRLYQSDYNKETHSVTITNLNPGKSKNFRATFKYYNYQYIANLRAPTASVSVGKLSW